MCVCVCVSAFWAQSGPRHFSCIQILVYGGSSDVSCEMMKGISIAQARAKCVSAFWAQSGPRHFSCKFLYTVALVKSSHDCVFFCCLGPYTPVLPTPLSTQCLRGHSGSIPLKVCLRRPNARVKRRRDVRFFLRCHTSACFWEGWKRNFCLRDHNPIHIFAK